MSDAFRGINRKGGAVWAEVQLRMPTETELKELCKLRPWRPELPVPVSTETYERMAALLKAK